MRALVLLMVLFSCSLSQSATLPFRIGNVANEFISVSENLRKVTISEYRLEKLPFIEFEAGFSGRNCKVESQHCEAGAKIPLSLKSAANLVRGRIFRISFEQNGHPENYEIDLLAPDFPGYRFEGHSLIAKPLITAVASLFSPSDTKCRLLIINPDGELAFARDLNRFCADFRPHNVKGQTYYSYFLVDSMIGDFLPIGPRVVLDRNYRTVRTIEGSLDMHEFLLFGPDHYLTIEAPLARGPGGILYVEKRVREYDRGKIIFDWGVSDFLKQFGNPFVACAFTGDDGDHESAVELLHINAVQMIGKSEFLIDLGFNGIVSVNRSSRKVVWVFGGLSDQFNVPLEFEPIETHMPSFDPGTGRLYVYANISDRLPAHPTLTKIMRFDLDVKRKRLNKIATVRAGPETAYAMGSLQVSDNLVYSIGNGGKVGVGSHFVETSGGVANFSVTFEDPQVVNYRFYRQPYGEKY